MTGKVRRVDYAPDEYIAGVVGVLRADEQGVYWMVCSLIMSEGAPIEANYRRLASLCLIRPGYAQTVVEKLVAMGKLAIESDGKISQKRALSEVELSMKRIQTAIENGSKGGRPRQNTEQKQTEPKTNGFIPGKAITNYQPPLLEEGVSRETLKSTKAPRKRISYSAKFSQFWTAYPTDALMSKAAAGKAFENLTEEDQDAAIVSIPAFKAYCSSHPDYRPVHAVRYLTQGRFEGFNQAATKVNSKVFVRMGSPEWEAILRKRNVASMVNKNHHGEHGFWFEKAEITAAMSRLEAMH